MNNDNKTQFYNFIAKWYGNQVLENTIKYNNQYKFNMTKGKEATHNNEADAFKHTYMQAQLSLYFGKHLAKVAGDFHEWQGHHNGQPFGEENMDKWNNQVGRNIAKEIIQEYGPVAVIPSTQINNIIARKVMKKMRAGELITNPNDKRKYTNGKTTGFAANSEHIFTQEEIDKMSLKEFEQQEKAIMQQLKEKGIPSDQELKEHRTKHQQSENGHWVTIEGRYVFIDE